jgi:hypothetical protein
MRCDMRMAAMVIVLAAAAAPACGSSDSETPSTPAAGSAGTAGTSGTGGAAGTSGAAGKETGGQAGTAGAAGKAGSGGIAGQGGAAGNGGEPGDASVDADASVDGGVDASNDVSVDSSDAPVDVSVNDATQEDTGAVTPDVVEAATDAMTCSYDSGVTQVPPERYEACVRAGLCDATASLSNMDFFRLCTVNENRLSAERKYGNATQILMMNYAGYYATEVASHESCVANAANCEAVFKCVNGGADSATCTVPAVSVLAYGASCTGNILNVCRQTVLNTTQGRFMQHDCTLDGLVCVQGSTGAACAKADCSTAGNATCLGDGKTVDYCVAPGVHITIDCAARAGLSGGQCSNGACVPTGAACTSSDPETCTNANAVAQFCHSTYHQWVGEVCADLSANFKCYSQGNLAACVADPAMINCGTTPYCDCDDLITCDVGYDGLPMRVHCPDYGFATCGDRDPATAGVQPGCIH